MQLAATRAVTCTELALWKMVVQRLIRESWLEVNLLDQMRMSLQLNLPQVEVLTESASVSRLV